MITSEQRAAYEEMLVRQADELLQKHCPSGPPFDPHIVAAGMGVQVIYRTLAQGVEGYSEQHGENFVAIVSNRGPSSRQRFTLAHELGHIQLMTVAKKGLPLDLIRFRAQKWSELMHQDPVEEALCNAFAAELLMPTDHVDKRIAQTTLGPTVIFDVADTFCVSMQASAKQVVRILGNQLTGCSLRKFTHDGWSLPVWWVGLSAEGRNLRKMADLVSTAANCRTELAQCWLWSARIRRRRTPKDRRVVAQVAPTRKPQHYLAFVGYRSHVLKGPSFVPTEMSGKQKPQMKLPFA